MLRKTQAYCFTMIFAFSLVGCVSSRKDILVSSNEMPLNFGTQAVDASVASILEQASTDFRAVLTGNKPTYARMNAKRLPADGGTQLYQGQGYRLTVRKSIVTVGKVEGYLYGPILVFDSKYLDGNSQELSHVEFYSNEALSILLNK